MDKISEVIYKNFRTKIYEDYSEFKEMCFKAPAKWVYAWAEQIAFREDIAFTFIMSNFLEEILTPEDCKKIIEKFDNRILYVMYLFWEESDFYAYDPDTLKEYMQSFMIRVNSEVNYFSYVDDYLFEPYRVPEETDYSLTDFNWLGELKEYYDSAAEKED